MGRWDYKRTWFLTYPQTDVSTMAELRSHLERVDDVEEIVVATEQHKDGNRHYHAYVKYVTGVKLSDAPTVFTVDGCKSGNYQPCRSPKAVIKYCTKETDYESNFDIKNYLKKKGKLSCDTIRAKSAKTALEDGDISIMQIRNYNLARSILCEPYHHHECRGLWIWGPPGTGKSHAARENFTDIYLKPQNKWFDGYQGEHTILLDDLDTPALAHLIKIWADKYACDGECKGGKCWLQHRTFIVTSNYHPEQLFVKKDGEPDYTVIDAITRRFRFVEKLSKEQSIFDDVPTTNVRGMSVSPNFNMPDE